ncbi:malate dehydrogenase [Culex quinquefasciatus]|uniref:Malate dehydrogenase n=1 Tax=Culex quinquefasciatus TaxID=7176 RepID=B0XF16_CULQU|nr:malate dehydrogenase [Culex quinquefasciatus]|eukprot:XP_001868238.1 malate dehydrogenase [Culex quinquefasciatus]
MLAEGTLHKRYRISWRRSSEEAAQPPQEVDQPQQEEDVCLSSRISDIASCCRLRISDRPGCSDCCDPADDDDAAATASPFPFSSYPCSTASSSTRKFGRRRRTHLPQLRPDTVKKVRVRTPRQSRLVLISTTILLPLLLLLHQPSCWAVLLDANGESAAGPAGGGGGGAPFGDGVGLSLGGSFNLEKSIAAVFSRVAYGSTTTTKRSIPDNVYVPSLTTVSTPLLTTFRYREKDKDPGMSLGGSGSGGGALGGTDLLGPGPGGAGGGAPHYNQQQISQNHRGYELDLERDHVLPTSAPNAEILKSNSNPTYPNPNRHHGHDRHRHSNSTPYPHGQHSGLFRSDITKATYFSTPLLLGKNGLEKHFCLPKVNANEKELLKKAIQELKKNIQNGEELVKKNSKLLVRAHAPGFGMAVRGKDLGPVEVFDVDSVRRGPDGVCKSFLAFLDEDPGLKQVSLAPAVSTGGGPRLDTALPEQGEGGEGSISLALEETLSTGFLAQEGSLLRKDKPSGNTCGSRWGGHPKKGFPTNPMFPGDIPSYSPPSRAFFTPPLPRNYTNPFADKPTLRGTNSDSTIINTNTYVNRRPLPPPSLMPGHERIPIRPDLNGSGAPAAPKVEEPVLVTGPASSSQSIEAQRRKPLNTPSEKSNKLEGGKSYGVDSKFMLDGGGNSSAILPNGMHFPSISRILSGSNGRTQTIPDVLLRSVTSAPRPNQPTFDLNAGGGGLPAVTSLSNAKNLNKGEGDEDGDGFEGGNENSGSRDEGEEEDDDDDGGGDDEEDVVGEKIDGSFYSTASVATSTVSSAGGHPASSSSPITQKMPNLNLKSVMIKANASGEEVGGGYGNDRNFATDIEDISTWTIAWNIHVYLSAILFTILAVYSIFKIIFYDKLTHLFSQSYFISIHLILIIICLLRIFYLCYDAYNIHFSFNLFTSELLLNLPLTFLTTTFAILILFLLLRSINHKTNRYSSILRPLTIMIGSGVHVGLCVTLHLVESYETQQFYHKQTQLLSRGGAAGHGPTNIQIPPRVLSLICQIIYIFICLSLGILYLYMYRLLKRILHKSQNYIHGYNNLSYAIHITIATALLFILLAALQIYGAISISSQTKVKLSPANMNDAAAAKKTLWASHIEIDWFQWGYQFSLRFIEIVIIALLSWVTGLKTGTSKGVPREKDMEQPNASGFALFPCTSSSSQENFETDYPAVCNANTNLHTYTLRTGKPIYDDNFALNSLNLEQNSAQDLQPNDFQRSIETNSMRSSSHNYSNNYNGSQQADQHDDFINDGEQMPDHYENPNFELKHHHRGEPPGGVSNVKPTFTSHLFIDVD